MRGRSYPIADLTQEQRDDIVVVYKRVGSLAKARQEIGLPESTIRRVLMARDELKKTKPPSPKPGTETVTGAKSLEKINPYQAAQYYLRELRIRDGLEPRLEVRKGLDFIDGLPVSSMAQRMRAVNAERIRKGHDQIGYCREWLV